MTCTFPISSAALVKEYGARGDGTADDSTAIQKALDSDCPVIGIPEGLYIIGRTLRVPSGKTILAHPNAVMRLADDAGKCRDDFIVTNSDHDHGNHHITIRGGVWDGNNEHNVRGKDGDMQAYTGVAVNFVNVRHLHLSDLTVRNPDSFFIRIGEVRHFRIENITFSAPGVRGNQDGVHIGGFCEDGFLHDLRAVTPMATNDDMVAINADDDVERAINLGMKRGPIRNIHVDGVFADSVYTFVRILSMDQPIENVRVRNVAGGVRRFALNMTRWQFPIGVGNIRNVHLSDFRVRKITTEYLDDPMFPESGLVRHGDMLGCEVDDEKRRMPHITDVASVSYPVDPLLGIGLRVRNLVLQNIHRAPEDTTRSQTLVLDNACPNVLELDVRSEDDVRRIFETSRGLTGSVLRFPDIDGVVRCRLTAATTEDGVVAVEQGPVEYLRVNAT